MQRFLIKDIRNIQLWNIICFGFLILLLTSFLIWSYTIKNARQQLVVLTRTLQEEVLEQRGLFRNQPMDPRIVQERLKPHLKNVLGCYPGDICGGFYYWTEQGKLVWITGGPQKEDNADLGALNNLGKQPRLIRKDQISLFKSKERGWMLKCDHPIIIDGRFIGYTSAHLTLTSIFSFFGRLGIWFLVNIILAGVISILASRWSSRKIRANIERLALDGAIGPVDDFDYEEIKKVAQYNHKVYGDLKAAEQSKAEMLTNCPWGYVLIDVAGNCVAINEKGTVLTGVTKGAQVNNRWKIMERPEEEILKVNGVVTQNVILHHFDTGEPRNFLVCAFPTILADGGGGIMAWFIDNTAQKQREEKIRQLAAIVEYSADAIFGFDAADAVTTWNYGAEKMYGYSAAEIIGKSHQILVPPELQEQLQGSLQMIREGTDLAEFETERICKDRSRIYVSVKISAIRTENRSVSGFSTIHRNKTDKKRYEVSLKAERERLAVTLNSIDAGVISTDKFGKIVFLNKNAARLTGWAVTEALEQPLLKILYLIDNQTSEAYEGLVAQVLGAEGPVQFHNAVLVNRDLQEIPISISCARIKTTVESFAGIVLVFQDISDKLKTEAELLRAEKLESLGILAGGIAHDFNNILAAVVANLQLASIKLSKGMDINKYLTDTIAISQRASELTKQLLTFSKGGAPVKRAASLVELIQETAHFVLHGSKVKAVMAIAPDLWPVEVDEGQISQVIHNLIINASQAMPEGGFVRVQAENVRIESGSRIRPGNYVRIAITDTGCGIPKEILHKIFDPYFTTKKDGNGLGLATTYSIIKKHDGYIEVESNENVGTTFIVSLPTARMAAVQEEAAATVEVSFEGAKILLMDDEEVILKVVGEMMKYFGYKVTLARDGAEAIRYYQQALETREPFDAVVMDLTIPGGMGGPEAMTRLREIDPGVRAIVSSGYYNDPIMADYESYGFCGVVRKPYRFEELNLVLGRIIEKSQLQLDLEYRSI